MRQDSKEEPSISNISINDTIQVYCDIEKDNIDARVLEVSDDPKTGEKQYYVHFLNFEKRMDKWVPQSLVKKNFGKISTAIEGSNLINHSMLNDNVVLTRKRSSLFSNEAYTEKDSADETLVKIKNLDKIIIGYYEIDAWYYSPFPSEYTKNKILFICEHCLKYMKHKNTLIKHIVSLFF